MPVDSPAKDPVKQRAGRLGMAKRWAGHEPPRVVRLDDLAPPARRLVMALIAAARAEADQAAAANKAATPTGEGVGVAITEGHGHGPAAS